MTSSTSLIWFRRLLLLGSVLAVVAATAAAASGSPRNVAARDVFERYAAAHPYGSTPVPDVLERYAAAHPYGVGTITPSLGTERIVDDSFRDSAPIATPVGDRIVDDSFRDPAPIATPTGDRIVDDSFRDPAPIETPVGDRIVDDSFRDAPTVVTAPTSGNSLDWGDFGIGAGAMLGLTVLLTGLGVGAVAMRHRSGGLKTS